MFNSGLTTVPYRHLGLFEALKSKINLSAILTNTQKTLNIVNQAIPIVYQVKPIVNNAKTIFKVIGAVNSKDTNSSNNTKTESIKKQPYKIETQNENVVYNNGPTFFL